MGQSVPSMHCSEVDPIQKPLLCPNGTEGYVTFMWNHVQLECHRFASVANLSCSRAWRRQASGKTAYAVCTPVRFADNRLPCGSHTSNEYVPKGANEALSMWAPTPAGRQLWRCLVSQMFKRISPQLSWTQVLGLKTLVHHTVASKALSAESKTVARPLLMNLHRE